MKKYTALFLLCLLSQNSYSAYGNFNSVLIGDRAAGMGGAFTALSGDPSSCSFYNPATLSWMKGSSLSASMSLFNKNETQFEPGGEFASAPLRVNQGAFQQIPSATGIFSGFGPFALGVSIVNPDAESFSGEIKSDDSASSIINLRDHSLWVGGTLSLNVTKNDSIGFTLYYTARDFFRASVDEQRTATNSSITLEEKTIVNNSLLYIVGYRRKLAPNWFFGSSIRFPNLQIHGKGNYYRSQVDNQQAPIPVVFQREIAAKTRIPAKLAFGIAYEAPHDRTYSLDIQHYGAETYQDMTVSPEVIQHRSITNISLGAEYYAKKWLRLRGGIFTNYSSHKKIQDTDNRHGDHINMWGFSANFAAFTSDNVSFTFGGYYTGGTGQSVQLFRNQLIRISKSQQIFSMLIGTAYYF